MKRKLFFVFFAVVCAAFVSGGGKAETREAGGVSIAVFIPGVMSGSPIYEMLAQGVKKAADEFAAAGAAPSVTVIEGRFNQAEWEPQVTTLAASGRYDLIVSSNPSLPVIVSSVSAKFPKQKFLLLDGDLEGNPSVYTLRYNQREQSYMAGFIAALVSIEQSAGNRRLGLLAAQEYPAMNNVILPGYTEGAKAVDPSFTVDFRVVGNWFDAARGAELAAEMIRGGVRVILPIAGGAGDGAVQAAVEGGAKIVWFDTNGYGIKPGTVVGSSILRQDKAAYEKTMLFLKGELPFGRAETAGIMDGYVDFVEDDPAYIAAVSPAIREQQAALIARLRSGALRLGD
jgi:simple sugar transport system substrate-binding protein